MSDLPAGPPGLFGKRIPTNGATEQPATISWYSSSGATSYEYCYDTSDDSACDGSWVSVGRSTSVGVSGLSANTTYYWQVRATNSLGTTEADDGTWWSFTTGAIPSPPLPVFSQRGHRRYHPDLHLVAGGQCHHLPPGSVRPCGGQLPYPRQPQQFCLLGRHLRVHARHQAWSWARITGGRCWPAMPGELAPTAIG